MSTIQHHYNISELHRLDDDISEELIKNMKIILADNDINFSGDLSKSIEPEIIDGIRYVKVNSPYGFVVDKGMPPGKNVNFDALKKWVQGKLHITDDAEANLVTAKIQKKILSKGIKPKFFMKKAIKMVIGKHGIIRVKNTGSTRKVGKLEKILNKTARMIKKVNRFMKKASRNLNKVDKAIKSTRR